MTKKAIDYSKGLIYKIECNTDICTDVYVGSTTDFTSRKSKHKSHCNNEKSKKNNLKVYKMIRDNGGFDNWTMVIVEKYPCDDVLELRAREQYWFKQLNSKLNTYVPGRDKKQYCEDNKDLIKERDKKKYDANIVEIRASDRQRYYDNKDIVLLKRKEFYIENKDKLKVTKKLQYEKTKHLILEKVKCECGTITTYNGMLRHLNTDTHLRLLNDPNDTLFLCECGSEISYQRKTRHINGKKHKDCINSIKPKKMIIITKKIKNEEIEK